MEDKTFGRTYKLYLHPLSGPASASWAGAPSCCRWQGCILAFWSGVCLRPPCRLYVSMFSQ